MLDVNIRTLFLYFVRKLDLQSSCDPAWTFCFESNIFFFSGLWNKASDMMKLKITHLGLLIYQLVDLSVDLFICLSDCYHRDLILFLESDWGQQLRLSSNTPHPPTHTHTSPPHVYSPENKDSVHWDMKMNKFRTTQVWTVLRNSPKFNITTRNWKLSQQTVDPNKVSPRFCVSPWFEGVYS